jgi:hypothetical protein
VRAARRLMLMGSGFNPATLPGVQAVFDAARSANWQDTSRTLPGGPAALVQAWDDLSVRGNNATGTAAPIALQPDPVTGVAALQFEPSQIAGGNDLLTATVAVSAGATVFFLCYCEVYQVATGTSLLDLRNTDNARLFTINDPGNLKFRVRTDAAADTNAATANDIRGTWARLILTYDGTTCTLYLNGASVGTLTPAGGGACTCNSLRLPATSGAAGFKLAAAGVYNRALTAGERVSLDNWMAAKVTAADPEPTAPTATSPLTLSDCDYGYDALASGVLRNGGSAATATGSVTAWQPTTGALTLSQPGGLDAPTMQVTGSTPFVRFQSTGTPSRWAWTSGPPVAVGVDDPPRLPAQNLHAEGGGRGPRGDPRPAVAPGPRRAGRVGLPAHRFPRPERRERRVGRPEPGVRRPLARPHHRLQHPPGRAWVDGAELVNGVNVTVPPSALQTLASSFTQGGFWLGYQGAGLACGFDVAAVTFHTAEHTFRQHRQTLAWARSYYTELFAGWDTGAVAVFTGASNMLTGSDTAQTLAQLCLAATAKYTRVYLLATGSLTSPPLRERFERQIKYLLAGRTGRKVGVIYVGGNDFVAGLSDADIALYKGYLRTALLAAGVDKNVEIKQLPRTGASDVARLTYNNTLAAAENGTDLFVVNVYADALIGADGANGNATYYVDGIHLTAAGTVKLQALTSPKVDAAFP